MCLLIAIATVLILGILLRRNNVPSRMAAMHFCIAHSQGAKTTIPELLRLENRGKHSFVWIP